MSAAVLCEGIYQCHHHAAKEEEEKEKEGGNEIVQVGRRERRS